MLRHRVAAVFTFARGRRDDSGRSRGCLELGWASGGSAQHEDRRPIEAYGLARRSLTFDDAPDDAATAWSSAGLLAGKIVRRTDPRQPDTVAQTGYTTWIAPKARGSRWTVRRVV